MKVTFQTLAEDIPSNLTDPRIEQVTLCFSRAPGTAFEVSVTSLRFRPEGAAGFMGGAATTVDGIISTRRGNAASWAAMVGKAPRGTWELTLPDTEDLRAHFSGDDIVDILFVITYGARMA